MHKPLGILQGNFKLAPVPVYGDQRGQQLSVVRVARKCIFENLYRNVRLTVLAQCQAIHMAIARIDRLEL